MTGAWSDHAIEFHDSIVSHNCDYAKLSTAIRNSEPEGTNFSLNHQLETLNLKELTLV